MGMKACMYESKYLSNYICKEVSIYVITQLFN